jgi:hypothetical protein
MDAPFGHVVESQDALREIYRQPAATTKAKKIGLVDELARSFIARSPFVLLASADGTGRCDVSPRGGPAGFVKSLDERRLVVPDLNGNNLLDSMENIVSNGQVGLLFLVPGRDETLRVNGRAWISTDPALFDLFEGELRRPVSVLGVQVEQAYVHCAKSFRRGGVWDPQSWPSLDEVPTGAAMLTCHIGIDRPVEETEQYLETAYVQGLAQDRPEPSVTA